MPAEHVELVRSGYEMFARGDLDGVLNLCDEEIELVAFDPAPTSFHGRTGVGDFLARLFGSFDEFRLEPERFVEEDERVLVLLRNRARTGSIEVDQPGGHLWTIRDGKAFRMVVYQDKDEALEAIGAG